MDSMNLNVENIAPEVIVLIVGLLVATMIIVTLIRGNFVRRSKLRQDLETLESARQKGVDLGDYESFNIKKENAFSVNTAFALQFVIGIGFLVGFSWWTNYLIQKGLAGWAIASGIFALIGLIMPFNAWSEIKRRKEGREQLIRDIENYENALARPAESSVTEAKMPGTPDQPSVLKEKESARWLQNIEDMIQFYAEKDREDRIPQDSTLRRHFVTQLLAELESGLASRPTDSTLKRHYDAMLDVEVENRLLEGNKDQPSLLRQASEAVVVVQQEQAPVAEAKQQHDISAKEKPDAGISRKVKIPEDSMLRRHFLAYLRAGIESGMPIRPTDSSLRRHYDAMIDVAVNKNLAV